MSTSIARRLAVVAAGGLAMAGMATLGGPAGIAGAADPPARPLAIPDAEIGEPGLFIPDPLPPVDADVGAWGPADRHDRAPSGVLGEPALDGATARLRPPGSRDPGSASLGSRGMPGLDALELPMAVPEGLAGLLASSGLRSRQDTFVSSRFPDTNYGSQSPMFVGETPNFGATRSLIWWDMNDLARNQAVRDARIELYLREAGPAGDAGRDLVMRRVTLGRNSNGTCRSSWNQSSPTWNNFPDYDDERISTTDVGTQRQTYSWGLTDLTRRWRLAFWWPGNECNGGVYLQGYETAGSFRGFDTREGPTPPRLVIDHVTDTTPPVGTMDALPPFTNRPDPANPGRAAIRLAWNGSDPSPATGIDFFQLFARNSNLPQNPWLLIGDRLQTFGGTYIAENGVRWEFVVYPTDQAGNVQPGKPPDTATHVDLNPPITTVTPLPAFVPGPFELTWTTQDQPNAPPNIVPSGVAYYDVQFNIGGGSWGDLAMGIREPRVLVSQAQQGLLYQFRVRAVDNAGNFEQLGAAQAQTFVDGVPPVILFVRAPFVPGERTFTVSWLGDDGSGSGLASYDLQVRVDQGPWTDWVTGSTETSRSYTGNYGQMISFRARARDRAGNVGAYPAQPQLVTAVVDPAILTNKIWLPVVAR